MKIDNGRDLQRLGELDEKYWTVLSCPVADLEFDQETLRLIDSDNDGKVRVGEMVGAARWLCSVIKNKDAKMMSEMQAKASEAVKSAPTAVSAAGAPAADASRKQPFDVAKFAGIFAALGLALGYIGSFLTKLAAGIAATPWWQLLLAVAVIMLIISGPSCFIAWSKLRRRNLGPVLNANGWAINSKVLVNIVFGAKLTSVAQYPKLRIADPDALKPSSWWKWLIAVLALALVAAAVLHIVGIVDLGIVWLSF